MQKQMIVGKAPKKRRRAIELYTDRAFLPRSQNVGGARRYTRRPKHQVDIKREDI